jgi:hypothetical protein
MPLIPFAELPDRARLWAFAASRPLSAQESASLLAATDEFLAGWTAHRVPLATAREFRFNHFLFVAVDEEVAGASGCSIDALVRFMRQVEAPLNVRLTDNGLVWFRGERDAIRCVTRAEFQRLVDDGQVGPQTTVFDNTIETTGALREGRWEVPAGRSWHGRAFFSRVSLSPGEGTGAAPSDARGVR